MHTRKLLTQKIAFALLSLSTLFVVLPVLAITFFLIKEGGPALSWSFLTEMPRNGMRDGGILPAIVGTCYLLIGTVVFAVPVGVMAAIYLSEYARQNMFTRAVRLAIVNLAGVPSIVFGLFGYGLFVLAMKFGKSILSGSLTLALLILPVIITASEEALHTVPKGFRDSSLALGATKWQTIWRVVIPNSAAGMITGIILGISRAAGETAPIMIVAAAYYLPKLPDSPLKDCMALPYHLYVVATEMFGAPAKLQWGTALVLLLIVLGLNIIASLIRSKYRKKRTW